MAAGLEGLDDGNQRVKVAHAGFDDKENALGHKKKTMNAEL